MITQSEFTYCMKQIESDIKYFISYKSRLRTYLIQNLNTIPQYKAKKIIKEIERIAIHIEKLKTEKEQYTNIINTYPYGTEFEY